MYRILLLLSFCLFQFASAQGIKLDLAPLDVPVAPKVVDAPKEGISVALDIKTETNEGRLQQLVADGISARLKKINGIRLSDPGERPQYVISVIVVRKQNTMALSSYLLNYSALAPLEGLLMANDEQGYLQWLRAQPVGEVKYKTLYVLRFIEADVYQTLSDLVTYYNESEWKLPEVTKAKVK